MSLRRMLAVISLSLVAFTVACDDDNTGALDGTMKTDGYALFSVDNARQQRDNVTVTVRNADPNATYVLFYSDVAPKNAGWFQFDPSTKERCGGEVGDHCKVDGYGWMVDYGKVAAGTSELTLRDERCGCDSYRDYDDWTGHWAVMRVERTNTENTIHFVVDPVRVKDFTDEPDISQLQ